MSKIPLDINSVVVPKEVYLSCLAYQIKQICSGYDISIPDELVSFVRVNDEDGDGYDWQTALLAQAQDMPIGLLSEWVSRMPGGLCRAEMRAILRTRKN